VAETPSSGNFFLACTPRTGNVWLRRMLGDCLGISASVAHNPAGIDWKTERLVAMHWRRTPDFEQLLARNNFQVIVTTRHPLDVLISILHFSQFEPATAHWLEGEGGDERPLLGAHPTSSRFLEYALSDRAAALLAVSAEWLPVAKAVSRYEELVADPETSLAKLVGALGEQFRIPFQDAVRAHTIDRLRPYSVHHFWRGQAGLWRSLIIGDYQQQIFERHRDVFDLLGYEVDDHQAPAVEEARKAWQTLCEEP
jgi:hypothetical protein